MKAPDFWIGTHKAGWHARYKGLWCVSARTLRSVKRGLRPVMAGSEVVIDSGGFTELSMHGKWTIPARQYAAEVETWAQSIGRVRWAATQDWMCEAQILRLTGLTVAEHQRRTVENFLRLRDLAPNAPWMPVIQGFSPDEYRRCVDMYAAAGVDLASQPIVGIGSVCRRQETGGIEWLVKTLHRDGIKLHGFGLKTQGLQVMAPCLASSDSMAWSFTARMGKIRLEGCSHATCANCPRWAMRWARGIEEQIRRALQQPQQTDMFY